MTTLNFLYCHEDPATAAAGRACAWSARSALANSHLLWTREAYPTRAYQSLGNLGARAPTARRRGGPGDAGGIPEGHRVGDPDTSSPRIKRWESIGVDGINFLLNALETIPQEEVLDSMRLFATEVMPQFEPRRQPAPHRPGSRGADVLIGTAPVEAARRARRPCRAASRATR